MAALALSVIAWGIGITRAGAQEIERTPIPTFVPRPDQPRTTGEVLVKFRDGVDPGRKAQILMVTGARVARVSHGAGFAVLQPRPGASFLDYLQFLGRRWEVAVAEPNYVAQAAAVDPYFSPYQWNLFDRGIKSGASPSNYGINAGSAWSYSRGAGVTVALLDTGCAYA